MNLALSTIGNIIWNYKKYGDGTANLPRNGRPGKINERTSRWINRNVQINPFIIRSEIKTDLEGARINVSKDTICRALYRTGFYSRSPRKVPWLKTKHVRDRLKFVETYEKKNMQFREKGIWSNEMKAEQFESGWFHYDMGCFSSEGTGELQVIHGRMNGSMYREILQKSLQKSATSLGHGWNFVLPHDNDPKYITKLTKEWFENNGISTLNWIQVCLFSWIQLGICGILWRLKFIIRIHKILSN